MMLWQERAMIMGRTGPRGVNNKALLSGKIFLIPEREALVE
jgi:hypothetical protein